MKLRSRLAPHPSSDPLPGNYTESVMTIKRKSLLYVCFALVLSAAAIAGSQPAPTPPPAAPKHPFTARDWATLHSAAAAAVSPEGTILYGVTFGAEKGPTHHEWWTIAANGAHAAKLDLQESFTPLGFTRDGHALYGT